MRRQDRTMEFALMRRESIGEVGMKIGEFGENKGSYIIDIIRLNVRTIKVLSS
jgi:hypothetical protein